MKCRIVLTVAVLAFTATLAEARNVALVIGNDHYANVPSLHTAVADANAIGDTLERLGFVVRRVTDAGQRAMSGAFAAFDADLQPGDEAFVFYAGHGIEISGINYLLPADVPQAQVQRSELVRDASFAVPQIIDSIRQRGPRVTILVLDACRDNPFATAGSRAAAQLGGLARVDAPEGVFVLMSAGAKQQALDRLSADDTERNSVFTRSFLGQLGKPGQTLVQIAKATQVTVRDLAATVGYEQTPAYYDQVVGEIVLSTPSVGPVASLAPHASPPRPRRRRTRRATTPPRGGWRRSRKTLGTSLPLGRAPIAGFMRSNAGWTATISLPEPATELFYRIGSAGAFKSTGQSDVLDQRTGERAPNLSFPLPSKTEATTIEVRYTTINGDTVGPFALRFDRDAALFHEQKKSLEQLQERWAEFRDFNGLLVYFTMLVTYRCAIAELHYGLNGNPPLASFALPGCRPDDPFSIPPNAPLFIHVPRDTRSITVQITWRDGTQSDLNTIVRN